MAVGSLGLVRSAAAKLKPVTVVMALYKTIEPLGIVSWKLIGIGV